MKNAYMGFRGGKKKTKGKITHGNPGVDRKIIL
jgi:hypothetical protein